MSISAGAPKLEISAGAPKLEIMTPWVWVKNCLKNRGRHGKILAGKPQTAKQCFDNKVNLSEECHKIHINQMSVHM